MNNKQFLMQQISNGTETLDSNSEQNQITSTL